jgi:hypothetical protein
MEALKDNQGELPGLPHDDQPGGPDKQTENVEVTDPSTTHVSGGDARTGKCPPNLQTLYSFKFESSSSLTTSWYLAPGSAAKPLLEESKKLIIEITKPLKMVTFLPELYEVPTFMGVPLIIKDDKGMTKFKADATAALIASVTITMKDVFRFASSLELCDANATVGEQMLRMVDNRFSVAR